MRSKLIISPHRDLVSSLRVSICPSSPLPNLQLPVLQMHPTTVPRSIRPLSTANFMEWMPLIATSGPHSLVMLKVGSGQQNACTLYCFFFCFLFFLSYDAGRCDCNVRCDGKEGSKSSSEGLVNATTLPFLCRNTSCLMSNPELVLSHHSKLFSCPYMFSWSWHFTWSLKS